MNKKKKTWFCIHLRDIKSPEKEKGDITSFIDCHLYVPTVDAFRIVLRNDIKLQY
jgi:hypothetical protein